MFLSIAFLRVLVAESEAGACGDLKAQIEALKKENAELKMQLADGSYVTTQAIVDGAGKVAEHLGVPDVSAVMAEVQKLNVSVGDFKVDQVADTMYSAYDVATSKLSSVASVVQEHHDTHVLPHASEYYKVAKPVVDSCQAAYNKNVAPQLAQAYDAASVAGTGLREKLKTLFEQSTLKLTTAFAGQESDLLKNIYAKQVITLPVLGWTKVFRHGVLDIALFLAQATVNIYVGLLIFWTLFKYVGFFGLKFAFRVSGKTVKTTFGLTWTTTTFAFRLVFCALSSIFTVFWLFLFCALGLSMMHGLEKSAKLGIDPSLRMMIGSGLGFLIFLPFCCCCCCRKKKKTEEKTNGKAATNGKASAAKAKPVAKKEEPKKAASATQAKSKGKK